MMQTTTVVIGAGHAGLAMSRRLTERSIDHVVLERGEVGELVADPALGLAAAAHPQLAHRLPGCRLQRGRPRRLHARCRRSSRSSAATPLTSPHRCKPHDGHPVAPHGDGFGSSRPTVKCCTPGPSCSQAGLRPASDPRRRQRRPPADHDAQRRSPTGSRPTRRRRRARRRRVGHRRPARRRDPPVRPPGDAGRRRTRPHAPPLPRPRHLLVAGNHGSARRKLRPDR